MLIHMACICCCMHGRLCIVDKWSGGEGACRRTSIVTMVE